MFIYQLKMVIFQFAMLVYQRVHRQVNLWLNLCHGTVFVVEELRGQGFGQFGFAHPCGPSEEEGASFAGKLEVIHPLF